MKDNPPRIERIDMRPIYPTQIPVEHPIVNDLRGGYTAVMKSEPKVCGFEAACDAMMFNMFSDTPAVVSDLGN